MSGKNKTGKSKSHNDLMPYQVMAKSKPVPPCAKKAQSGSIGQQKQELLNTKQEKTLLAQSVENKEIDMVKINVNIEFMNQDNEDAKRDIVFHKKNVISFLSTIFMFELASLITTWKEDTLLGALPLIMEYLDFAPDMIFVNQIFRNKITQDITSTSTYIFLCKMLHSLCRKTGDNRVHRFMSETRFYTIKYHDTKIRKLGALVSTITHIDRIIKKLDVYLRNSFSSMSTDSTEDLTQYQILVTELENGRKEFSHYTEPFTEKEKREMLDKFYKSVSDTLTLSHLDKPTKIKYQKQLSDTLDKDLNVDPTKFKALITRLLGSNELPMSVDLRNSLEQIPVFFSKTRDTFDFVVDVNDSCLISIVLYFYKRVFWNPIKVGDTVVPCAMALAISDLEKREAEQRSKIEYENNTLYLSSRVRG